MSDNETGAEIFGNEGALWPHLDSFLIYLHRNYFLFITF